MPTTNLQSSRVRSITQQIWAIRPQALYSLLASASSMPDELAKHAAEVKAARRAVRNVQGRIAVVPIRGVLAQHRDDWYGDTSTDEIGGMVDLAMESPEVGTIVLDIESPGGIVSGVHELWSKLMTAKESKPIVSVVNSMAASAAYYLASASTEIVATDGSLTGSIGTLSTHLDVSKLLDNEGIKATFIFAGKYKVEGNELEPLGDEAREEIQRIVDSYYGTFVGAVAQGRKVSEKRVREEFGEGRVFRAEQAVAMGLVDRVGTLESVLSGIAGKRSKAIAVARAAEMRKREMRLRALGL
jgi:signal peptide peptidase SppA